MNSVLNDLQESILFQETPKDAIKRRKGAKGKTFDYVTGAYVIRVLNSAFGNNWSFTVKQRTEHRYKLTKNTSVPKDVVEFVVQGCLSIPTGNGKEVIKEQFGNKVWNEGLSMGDAIKSAATDALKKCASLMGVALDLYEREDDYLGMIEDKEKEDHQNKELERTNAEKVKQEAINRDLLCNSIQKLAVECSFDTAKFLSDAYKTPSNVKTVPIPALVKLEQVLIEKKKEITSATCNSTTTPQIDKPASVQIIELACKEKQIDIDTYIETIFKREIPILELSDAQLKQFQECLDREPKPKEEDNEEKFI